MLADEATRRDTQSAQLRARKAGLDPGMRIETWDETAAVRYDRTRWNELASLRFLAGGGGGGGGGGEAGVGGGVAGAGRQRPRAGSHRLIGAIHPHP